MREPDFRCSTNKAILRIAEQLNLEYNSEMQDWDWEIANPNHIKKYIVYYRSLTNDDEKFTLMEIIIQALTEQEDENFKKYWKEVEVLLNANFEIHEYTVFYWSCFQNNDLEDCSKITSYLRSLWKERNVG